MKNNKVPLILSIVALLGVVLLFVDRLSNKSPKQDKNQTEQVTSSQKIVFVNLDTVLNHYDLYNALSLKLMEKQSELEKELQSKTLSLQNRAYKLQQDYAQHLITSATYQEKAQKLSDEQYQLQVWQEEKTYELTDDQMALTQRIYDSIINVVNEINADKKYNLVISNSLGGTLLYGDPEWNITDTVVSVLNSKLPDNFLDSIQ